MVSTVPTVRAAVVGVLQSMFPEATPTLVSYGDPGSYQPNEIVVVGGSGRISIDRPTSTPARAREETVELDIIFSVFAPGGPEQQQSATERAFSMLSSFADYFKTKPNETLGGKCREALVTSYDYAESIAYDSESLVDPEVDAVPIGRVCEISAVLTTKTRI